MINLQKWLKDLREETGHTQESIAELVGIAKTTYSSYEQGHRQPSIVNAKKLAEVLNVPWTIFFDNEVRKTYAKNKEVTK